MRGLRVAHGACGLGFFLARFRFRRNHHFAVAAFFLRAHLLGAAPLGGFQRQDRPAAFRAGFGHRRVPGGVLALGVGVAAVEQLTVAALAFDQVAGLALRAFHAGVLGFFQRLDVFALGVVGAADELAIRAVFHHQLSAVFRAHAVFDHHGRFLRGVGVIVEVAGVVAFRVAGAADKAAALAKADVPRLAALGAGFVQRFGGDFGAAYAFFFFQLLVKALPEALQHRHPLALAGGDFIELIFQLGGEVVIDVLLKMLGQEFIDDVASVGGDKAFFIQVDV